MNEFNENNKQSENNNQQQQSYGSGTRYPIQQANEYNSYSAAYQKKKKQHVAPFVAGAILMVGLCGVAGFGGTLIASSVIRNNAAPREQVSEVSTKSSSTATDTLGLTLPESSGTTQVLMGGGAGDTLTIAGVTEKTADSVVEITTEVVSTSLYMGQYVSEGAGSGVILTKDGYIITNNHVIDGASSIIVTLRGGKQYKATLIGTDPQTDIAVIKIIPDEELLPATIGDSGKLVVGEGAVAIGNPLGQLGGTVTEGIISALDREITIDGTTMHLLQTSAAINPGNSGGGLFNMRGELVGIVNAKKSGSGIEGLGFAVPINIAKEIAGQLIDGGYVRGRIELGMQLIDISDPVTAMMYRVNQLGVYVYSVDGAVGFMPGDLIVSADGKSIESADEFDTIINAHSVGDVVNVEVYRGRNTLSLKLKLNEDKPQQQ